jgi:hypothetical protein
MGDNITIAIIGASASVITAFVTGGVAVVALILNNKRFDDFSKRLDKIEAKLEHIEGTLAGYVVDVATMKGKLGLS